MPLQEDARLGGQLGGASGFSLLEDMPLARRGLEALADLQGGLDQEQGKGQGKEQGKEQNLAGLASAWEAARADCERVLLRLCTVGRQDGWS